METPSYSQHSFYPFSKQLKPLGPLARVDLLIRANRVNERINTYLEEKNLPSKESAKQGAYRVGIYGELGRGTDADVLAHDLSCFLMEQKEKRADGESFWAVFYDTPDLSDEQFKQRTQWELSSVLTILRKNESANLISTINENSILLYFGITPVFITGLHRNRGMPSSQFHYATLVFSTVEPLCLYQNH